jgi:ATP-dependent protease ClpP protease subunit
MKRKSVHLTTPNISSRNEALYTASKKTKGDIMELLEELKNAGENIEILDGPFDGKIHDLFEGKVVTCQGNRIFFKGAVSEKSVAELVRIINTKNDEFEKINDNKMIKEVVPNPLILHITSYGGDLLAGFRAIDAITSSRIPVYTIIDGHSASAATFMSIVGKKRYMTPNSHMLIHQLSGSSWGKFSDIEDDYTNCKTWMNKIYSLYVNHTKMRKGEIVNYLKKDVWWEVDDCISKGLVDEVYIGQPLD